MFMFLPSQHTSQTTFPLSKIRKSWQKRCLLWDRLALLTAGNFLKAHLLLCRFAIELVHSSAFWKRRKRFIICHTFKDPNWIASNAFHSHLTQAQVYVILSQMINTQCHRTKQEKDENSTKHFHNTEHHWRHCFVACMPFVSPMRRKTQLKKTKTTKYKMSRFHWTCNLKHRNNVH